MPGTGVHQPEATQREQGRSPTRAAVLLARSPILLRGLLRVVDDQDAALRALFFALAAVVLAVRRRLGQRQIQARAAVLTLLFAAAELLDDERVEHGGPPAY